MNLLRIAGAAICFVALLSFTAAADACGHGGGGGGTVFSIVQQPQVAFVQQQVRYVAAPQVAHVRAVRVHAPVAAVVAPQRFSPFRSAREAVRLNRQARLGAAAIVVP